MHVYIVVVVTYLIGLGMAIGKNGTCKVKKREIVVCLLPTLQLRS